jgi:hypothetical protein
MPRRLHDWLSAYLEFSDNTEAPARMRFWSAVSAVAGAMRRKCWIDQYHFRWYPNLFVIFVAPPGIVAKSTTSEISYKLLRQLPEIQFGPEATTWQALVTAFTEASETFDCAGKTYIMSPLSIESSEFGNLINTQDRDMINAMITLWDNKPFKKRTKGGGIEDIQNPWLNVIACTTPAWIAANIPQEMIGGGFVSRCLFVFTDTKAKYVAYPSRRMRGNIKELEADLVHDLMHIARNITGPYILTEEAMDWGEVWYEEFYKNQAPKMDQSVLGGYIARKQVLTHKLAMIIVASQRDERIIHVADLERAVQLVTELEADMPKVFARIGATEISAHAQRLLDFIKRAGILPYATVYRYVQSAFPGFRDFEDVLLGFQRAGYVALDVDPLDATKIMVRWLE